VCWTSGQQRDLKLLGQLWRECIPFLTSFIAMWKPRCKPRPTSFLHQSPLMPELSFIILGKVALTLKFFRRRITAHNHTHKSLCCTIKYLTFTIILLSLPSFLCLPPPLYRPFDLDRFFRFLILYTVDGIPRMGDQPVARPLPTHRTTKPHHKSTGIHALNGILTHDTSVRADEDSSCLRPRVHCDRPLINLFSLFWKE
jgi:hypothetical protein